MNLCFAYDVGTVMKMPATLFPLVLLVAAGCAPDAPTPSDPPGMTSVPRLQLSSERFALVVEFGTGGDPAGCDLEAGARLDAIEHATQPLPRRLTTIMGLEGERDVCFRLDQLTSTQRTQFIERVRREVGSGRNVTVKEDEPCWVIGQATPRRQGRM